MRLGHTLLLKFFAEGEKIELVICGGKPTSENSKKTLLSMNNGSVNKITRFKKFDTVCATRAAIVKIS